MKLNFGNFMQAWFFSKKFNRFDLITVAILVTFSARLGWWTLLVAAVLALISVLAEHDLINKGY